MTVNYCVCSSEKQNYTSFICADSGYDCHLWSHTCLMAIDEIPAELLCVSDFHMSKLKTGGLHCTLFSKLSCRNVFVALYNLMKCHDAATRSHESTCVRAANTRLVSNTCGRDEMHEITECG